MSINLLTFYAERLKRFYTAHEISNSEHLFGPIALYWHYHCPTADGQQTARRRMDEIWDAYTKLDASIPWLGYMVGIWLDAHIPMVTRGANQYLSSIYRRSLAPEQIRLSDIWTFDTIPNLEVEMETLWYNTETGRCNKKTPSHTTVLMKCLPNPVGNREIHTTLYHLLDELPGSTSMIVRAVNCFLLGAYKSTTVPAPPAMRIAIYTTTDYIGSESPIRRVNRTDIDVIMRFIIVECVKSLPAMHAYLQQMPWWTSYSRFEYIVDMHTVARGGDVSQKQRRQIKRWHREVSRTTDTYSNQAGSSSTLIEQLCKTLEIKYRIPASTVQVLGTGKTRQLIQDIWMAAAHDSQPKLYAILFTKYGGSADCLRALTSRNRSVSAIINTFKEIDVAIIRIHTWALILYWNCCSRRKLSSEQQCIYRYSMASNLPNQRKMVIVCRNCMSCRSRYRSTGPRSMQFKRGRRRTHKKIPDTAGVTIDPESDTIRCRDCQSTTALEVVPTTFHILSVRSDVSTNITHTVPLLNCFNCGELWNATDLAPIGIGFYCKSCEPAIRSSYIPMVCLCGVGISVDEPIVRLAYGENNDPIHAGLCSKHAHLKTRFDSFNAIGKLLHIDMAMKYLRQI